MLTSKELMQLEDFLNMEQTCVKSLNYFASQVQNSESKQLFQQMAQKNQQHFNTMSKHLSAGQSLQ